MGDVGAGHVTTGEDRIQVMRTDRRVKHGSSTSRPDNPEITGAGRVAIAVGQEEEPQERAEKEKRHPFPLLSLPFVSLSFLAESRCFVNPFLLFPLENASDPDISQKTSWPCAVGGQAPRCERPSPHAC